MMIKLWKSILTQGSRVLIHDQVIPIALDRAKPLAFYDSGSKEEKDTKLPQGSFKDT